MPLSRLFGTKSQARGTVADEQSSPFSGKDTSIRFKSTAGSMRAPGHVEALISEDTATVCVGAEGCHKDSRRVLVAMSA